VTTQLFEIPQSYERFADFDLPDDGAELESAIADVSDEVTASVLSLAKVVLAIEAEAVLLEQHVRTMNAKAGARRRRAEYLKRWVKLQMEGAGLDRVKDPFVSVWLQKSPPAVEVLDEAAIPPEFLRAVLRLPFAAVPAELRGFLHHLDVDRAAILELSKRTGEIPSGVRIRNGERHLRMR
jgi:hypothetical protein